MATAISETISINLVYDYPVRWSQFKVLRDFVQNFYDAVQWPNWDSKFSYTLDNSVLTLKASDVGFSYDWLLHIGASTKRETSGEYAGYFGEGFKIAALCALRDYGWQIEVCSRDWALTVITTDINVDEQHLQSLAYRVERRSATSTDTILRISPFDDAALLESVLLSFYYPTNPLFGEKIYEGSDCAVYLRSKVQKPRGYPATTTGSHGKGIVFASYQALGSFQYPLVFCLHDYRHNDRERNSFFQMDVIRIIHRVVSKLPPAASSVVLQSLKGRWYDRPRKKYDFESWYDIVATLVRSVSRAAEETLAFRETHLNLLVAHQVKRNDLQKYNCRRQALDWLKNSEQSFRLVQSAFAGMGYPTLESVCEQHKGFSLTRQPHTQEKKRIEMLETFVQTLIPEVFSLVELPPCQIIKSESAAWMGMANCIPIKSTQQKFRGIPIRYQLPYVALKSSLLHSATFGSALSTYLHELAHMFGGDRSAAFSHALSELMEITLSNARLVAKWQEKWESLSP
ncbi:MAG: hypothetical protein AAFQ95_23380 [Cyanobacteria bacterium J06621_3]